MGVRNIVLITVDALRADHLSSYGYSRNTTPSIDKLASKNVLFENAFSASSFTREAVPSLLTGHFPSSATTEDFHLAKSSIASNLATLGYETGAFHSNPYVSRAYGFDRGFDEFNDDLYLGNSKLIALAQRALDKLRNRQYARAGTINERALQWIDETQSPFFVWNHYMDVHGPYDPPSEYRGEFCDKDISSRKLQQLYRKAAVSDPGGISEEEERLLIDYYDSEIKYVDEKIMEFIHALADRGLLSTSLIIITADHGDGFGEHGYYGHPRNLHPELTHVPLLLLTPDKTSTVISEPVSTLDIAPTILEHSGEDSIDLPGHSLYSVMEDTDEQETRVIYSSARGDSKHGNGGVRRFAARTKEAICYLDRDLSTGEIINSTNDSSDSVYNLLVSHSEKQIRNENESKTSDSDLNSDIDRRLEALGYK